MVEENKKENNKLEHLETLKKILGERNKRKDSITTCEWCGMTYPKGGWTYYKICVVNMNLENMIDQIEKGSLKEFSEHIICSDCHGHLKICKEC